MDWFNITLHQATTGNKICCTTENIAEKLCCCPMMHIKKRATIVELVNQALCPLPSECLLLNEIWKIWFERQVTLCSFTLKVINTMLPYFEGKVNHAFLLWSLKVRYTMPLYYEVWRQGTICHLTLKFEGKVHHATLFWSLKARYHHATLFEVWRQGTPCPFTIEFEGKVNHATLLLRQDKPCYLTLKAR